jgi:hypothetical protein
MARLRYLAALGLALFAGCGNPETDRLAPGSRAVIVDPEGRTETYLMPRLVRVPVGSRVTVTADGQQTSGSAEYRDVTIHIDDGPAAGETAKISRLYLRPAK